MSMPPDAMICFALYSAAHAMQQAYRPLLDPLGLTYPQYLVLSALWSGQEPPTVGAIGRQLQLESSTLTPLLKRLEAIGLIRRTRDTADERQVRVHLTDDGRAMQARAAHVPDCILERTGMTPQALLALRDRLRATA